MWFQLKLAHCPRSLAASLAALPSMSLIPFAPLKLVRCPTRSSLLQFPIAVPGFLDALAALGTSRRKVNSHQHLTALPAISLIPSAPFTRWRDVRRSRSSAPMWSESNAITSAHVNGRSLNPMVNQRSANVAGTAIKAMPTGTETADANG